MFKSTSFALLSLWNILDVPSTRIPVDGTTFVSYVLPPVVCYFALAMLAVTPQTQAVRLALWPPAALLALRAMLSVDMSHSKPKYTSLQTTFLHLFCFGIVHSFGWTLKKEPFVRHFRPQNSSPSTIFDALDLASNFRGHGWEWSGRLYVPQETRPTNRRAFVFHAFLSVVVHGLICGVFRRAALTLLPVGVGPNPNGSTLFDETLPSLEQYVRASIITIFQVVAVYAGMQNMYDLWAILAILFLGQEPAQWPPIFDAPWRATSLSDFWAHRWHQLPRHMLLLIGGYPMSFVLGRTGVVIGTFLASALWHHIHLLVIDNQADVRWMFLGFGMMIPGVLAERAFHWLTGRPVGGVVGWVWTMVWLVLWGNVMFEGNARAPMMDRSLTLIDHMLPVRELVDHLIVGFDAWLRAA